MITRIFPIKTLIIVQANTKKQQREEKRAEKKIKKMLKEA